MSGPSPKLTSVRTCQLHVLPSPELFTFPIERPALRTVLDSGYLVSSPDCPEVSLEPAFLTPNRIHWRSEPFTSDTYNASTTRAAWLQHENRAIGTDLNLYQNLSNMTVVILVSFLAPTQEDHRGSLRSQMSKSLRIILCGCSFRRQFKQRAKKQTRPNTCTGEMVLKNIDIMSRNALIPFSDQHDRNRPASAKTPWK